MLLSELAESIGGTLDGDGSRDITGIAPLNEAGPTDLAFLANPAYQKHMAETKAAAVLVAADWAGDEAVAVIRCEDPYYAFRQAMVLLYGFRRAPFAGVDPAANIDPTATLGDGVSIGRFVTVCRDARIGADAVLYPGVFIGPDAKIGRDCILHPNVVVYDRCALGDRVTVHANSVIGQDGFGYATHAGVHEKIPAAGSVWIGDDVEIGAGCTVDRATIGATEIGPGSKFSNQVAIGHGVKVGPANLMVAQSGIAGSTTTGKYCLFGGQAGVVGHLKIGDFAQIGAQAGVTNDVPANCRVWGTPATPLADARKQAVVVRHLPEIKRRIKELERELARLTKSIGGADRASE